MQRTLRFVITGFVMAQVGACTESPKSRVARDAPQTVKCSVIGGLADTGLWQSLGERFESETGHKIEIVARGPRHEIVEDFVSGRSHLIAMHAGDTMINLVADGHASEVHPWARNDFLLVGPEDDPAGIRGGQDAAAALQQIIGKKSKLLVHSSHGATEVLRDLMESRGLEFDPEQTLIRLDDRQRQMLLYAAEQKAYTLVGRIPYLNGKIPKQNLAIMVQGDPRLRRPYLVAVSTSPKAAPAEIRAAQTFSRFLRTEPTQQWIAEYGRGMLDDQPLFFRVELPSGE